jgi:hypothetical protein
MLMSEPDFGRPADPAEWPGGGTYVPEPDQQTGQSGCYRPAPHRPAGHRHTRQSARPLAIMALLLSVIAAIAEVAFFRSWPVSHTPADASRASATSGMDVTAHGRRPASGQPPAITKKQAEQVVSHYWTVNNEANEQRSDWLLGTIEAGSSYTMDVGAYRYYRASNPSGAGYVPFTAAHTTYYIPWQSAHAAYPHWFAVAVTYADLSSPQDATGSGYLVFSQASPGAAWKDVAEPYIVPGSGQPPQIATDAKGYATQVSPRVPVGRLAIAPGKIGPVTAAALDNPGAAAIKVPGNLADERDKAFWQSRLPAGSTDSDKHQSGPGPVFGLRTTDGGAILFYSINAQLTLAPPADQTFELDVPGYYSPSQPRTSASVGYIEQFAAYDPPQGQTKPYVVADASSIAGD